MFTRLNLWKRVIPELVPNRLVLAIFTIIAFFSGHINKEIRKKHFEENASILDKDNNGLLKDREYVENQHLWGRVKFGSHKKSNMAYSGCEIIATYNAILSIGLSAVMPEIISVFEKSGSALHGGFGIAPSFPARFFKKKGCTVKRLTTRNRQRIDSFGKEHETFLLTFYWDKKDITKQLHTVNISKIDGKYLVHNAYHKAENGRFGAMGPYNTLAEAINAIGENVTPMVIYGIDKNKNLEEVG